MLLLLAALEELVAKAALGIKIHLQVHIEAGMEMEEVEVQEVSEEAVM